MEATFDDTRIRSRARSRESLPPKLQRAVTGQHALQRKQASCACGGGCPRCQEELPVQTKLQVSHVGEPLEREADRVADEVVRTEAGHDVTQTPHKKLRSGGEPLDQGTRNLMEERFGTRFDDVRVHHDTQAAQSAQVLQAQAYTRDSDIVFGENQYAPSTPAGRAVLAHELAHVVQGRSVADEPYDERVSHPAAAAEREAHAVSADYAAGHSLRPIRERASGLHRVPLEVTTPVTETISNAPAAYSAWNGVFSWTSRFGILLNATARTLTVVMRLYSTANAAVKTRWASAVERKWGGRFGLHVSGATAGAPAECYRINVDVQWVNNSADAHYTITPSTVGSTSGGRAGVGGTTGMTHWGTADRVDITHEFGHMLGNTEEYFTTNGVDFTRGGARRGFRDAGGGVMNNPSGNPEPRHYELVRLNAATVLSVAETRCTVGTRCRTARTGDR